MADATARAAAGRAPMPSARKHRGLGIARRGSGSAVTAHHEVAWGRRSRTRYGRTSGKVYTGSRDDGRRSRAKEREGEGDVKDEIAFGVCGRTGGIRLPTAPAAAAGSAALASAQLDADCRPRRGVPVKGFLFSYRLESVPNETHFSM